MINYGSHLSTSLQKAFTNLIDTKYFVDKTFKSTLVRLIFYPIHEPNSNNFVEDSAFSEDSLYQHRRLSRKLSDIGGIHVYKKNEENEFMLQNKTLSNSR